MAGQPNKSQDRVIHIKILKCNLGYSGKNKRGDAYEIYEIEAENGEGKVINEKLRSFSALPIGQVVEVTVKKFTSEKYGDSYTLTPKKGVSGKEAAIDDLAKEVEALKARVAALERNANPLNSTLGQQAPIPG
jgi:archaellum component FlaC